MAIHVQDEEADWLLREFARKRGVGLTSAIKIAVREASRQDVEDAESFLAIIRPVIDRARARKNQMAIEPRQKQVDHVAFIEKIWGEQD